MDGTTKAGAAALIGSSAWSPGRPFSITSRILRIPTGHFAGSATSAGRSTARSRAICRISASRPRAWPEQEARILRIFKRKAHQFLEKPPGPGRRFPMAGADAAPRRADPADRFHLVALRGGVLRAGADARRWRGVGHESGAHRQQPRSQAGAHGSPRRRQFPPLLPEGQPPLHLDGGAAHHEPAADRAVRDVRGAGRSGRADRGHPERPRPGQHPGEVRDDATPCAKSGCASYTA